MNLKELDKKLFDVNHFSVSGAYEIPQLLNILLKDKKYAFCVALGCIIKGQTPHFDIISQSVSDKLLEISSNSFLFPASAISVFLVLFFNWFYYFFFRFNFISCFI